ncbi:MAG: ABC transporter substrate-binding protein, partial [Chloroflexi bacterium]|nr:ABC transporter substrate-binding protein [Chloroflexota bacterium]
MSKLNKWPLVATGLMFGTLVLGACQRDDPPKTAGPTQVVAVPPTIETETATAEPGGTTGVTAVVTVEVTRLVVETEVVEVTPEPEPEEPGSRELVICLSGEPQTLFPYSHPRLSTAALHLHQAIYENMFTTLSYSYQARGIEKLPSLADGDAVIQSVEVAEGDVVQDHNGDVVALEEGVRVRTADGTEVVFGETPLQMNQMVVRFTLKPLVWSDSRPVTADDSVYSFELASDSQTPVSKYVVERTASYTATGDLTLEWTSIPGYLDPTYFTNVWTPYPRHYWGQFKPGELIAAEPAARAPLSHGPYVLAEWVEGNHIRLVKNEHYYLAGEGLPKLDAITFTFVPNRSQLLAQLTAGQCDVVTHDGLSIQDTPFLLDAEGDGVLTPYFQTNTVFEHIDFGINPADSYALTRPDWFEDVRVRQAFVMCTDRQGMADEILYGRSEVIHAYVPAGHPLYPQDATEWAYDVGAANSLLDQAGYLDNDGDGLREDPGTGRAFVITLLTAAGNEIGEQLAVEFSQDLLECGVEVEVRPLSSDFYFADGPDGPLFGRQFDLSAFPWLISVEPNCALYLSSQIPGPANDWDRSFNNETGFTNEAFDAACQAALNALPGTPEYATYHTEALRLWTEQVPVIPLLLRLKVAATRPDVVGFIL